MAITSGFFPSVSGDRKYTNSFLAQWVHSFIGNGVYDGDFAVTAGENMNVVLPKGQAWINGYYCRNDGNIVLPIENADGILKRKDTVVLRWDINTRDISVKVLTGKFASEPTAPEIVRSAEQYDLKLAEIDIPAGTTQITQADITDTRLDNNVCGIVHGIIKQADTTALYKQIQSDLAQFKGVSEADFSNWSEEQKTAFNAWLEGIKTVLDDDTAGNLLNLINQVKTDFAAHTSDTCHIQAGEREKWNASGVSTYKHEKNGTVHNLQGVGNNIEFLATADFVDDDTWTVNGQAVTAVLSNGEPLTEDTFKSGNWVTGVRLDGDKLNFRSGGGGGCKFNAFVQPDEPDIKNGIWLKTSNNFRKAIVDTNVYEKNSRMGTVSSMPYGFCANRAICAIGSNIYATFYPNNSSNSTNCNVYLYNTNSNSWSTFSNCPAYPSVYGYKHPDLIKRGTDIYMCWDGKVKQVLHTLSKIWSSCKNSGDPPNVYYGYSICSIYNKIYMINGSTGKNTYKHIYSWDMDTETWVQEGEGPDTPPYFGTAESVGNDIYLIGGRGNIYIKRYNIVSKIWTDLVYDTIHHYDYSYREDVSTCVIGSKIYCFGGINNEDDQAVFNFGNCFNTETNSLESFADLGVGRYGSSSVLVNNKIYCLGGKNIHNKYLQNGEIFSLISKQYDEDTLIILVQKGLCKYITSMFSNKKLTGNFFSYFDDAWLFKDGDLQNYPAYYGNGSSWIKFK